ncbi:MAG: zinc ABC transporter substrate-binding protein [Aquabacterium sp.]
MDRRAWLRVGCGWVFAQPKASWPQASKPTTIPSEGLAKGWPALKVVASFSILADMVRQIAGPLADVHSLVGPNADAHVFEPSPKDTQLLRRADLVIVNGLHFEGWIDRLVNGSGYRGPVVTASEGVQARRMDGGGGIDPHAWQDLRLAGQYAGHIEAALAARMPAQAATIRARASRYRERFQALHQEAARAFGELPVNQKCVLTSHDAFGYFGAAYGIRFEAPQGWSTDTEASAAKVAALVREIKARQVRALFVENMTDPRLVRRIAEETGARIGGVLYPDALSLPDGPAATYLDLMRHNIQTLLKALR